MPELKIYDDSLPLYDKSRAELNLASKTSTDRLQIFANFLGERQNFDKMMNLLIELTPPDLMDKDTVENSASLAHVLEREDDQFYSYRYDHIPRFHFHEVPSIPHPLTRENFSEYIYFLTHSKILYRNSSSLTSGIVPEILLHTHNLENKQFKPFRSVETYNYLIKYFGFDKFQNSFARELLLVMVEDGHKPNINTINQLLKICRIHANRRSIVSTYKVVINYLNLAKNFDLRPNLSTWNRIYDCIDNIFLKEAFLNKISTVSLPVSNNMCIRILGDFCETTRDTNDVISFLESDLRRPYWREDPRMADKVLYHRIKHMSGNDELSVVFENLYPGVSTDALTLKTLANAIDANPNFTHKAYLILCMYTQLSIHVDLVPPEVYSRVIQLLAENKEGFDLLSLNMIARGVIHYDATKMLKLPIETTEYEKPQSKHFKQQRQYLPYNISNEAFGEHYRIFKRLSKKSLNTLEAKVIHTINNSQGNGVKYPWEPLSQEEEARWKSTTAAIRAQERFWENSSEKARSVGFIESTTPPVPEKFVIAYDRYNSIQMRVSNEITTVKKLRMGLDKHLENEMRERRICLTAEPSS
ncbi:hypothetical protein JCM33374_g1157 [Metschnikowia sp. JCM 33374]|nr:hypothetical protein JCM33374_g1157 [Metschnikowia sp. JCM 33374]